MSVRVDTTSLIAGAVVVGDRGLGVTGAVIRATTATGTHGPGILYDDWDSSADDTKEFRALVVTPPSAGTLYAYEDGSFSLIGAPDGTYTLTYRLYVDGVDLDTTVETITIGAGGGDTALVVSAATHGHAADNIDLTVTLVTIYRPSSDIAVTGWTATGAASVAAAIGETVASDTEYGTSPDLSTNATISLTASMPAGTYNVRVRSAYVGASGQVRIRFLNASNVDQGGTSWQVLTGSATTYTLSATTTGTADRFRIEVQ